MKNINHQMPLSIHYNRWQQLIYALFFCLISYSIGICHAADHKGITSNSLSNHINSDTVVLPFSNMFGQYWQKTGLTTWQLAVPLHIKNNLSSPIHIQWGSSKNHLVISKKAITFYNENNQKQFYEPIRPNTHDLYIVFESNGTDRHQVQIVQTKQNVALTITPYIHWPIAATDKSSDIKIDGVAHQQINPSSLVKVVGNKDVMQPIRKRREALGHIVCGHSSFWILDFLMHSHCEFSYSGTDIHSLLQQKQKGYAQIGGTPPEQQIKPPPYFVKKQSAATLKQMISGTEKHPILSSYAAAKTCFVPLHKVISSRKPRGLNNDIENDCVYNTEQIISLYTSIYGTSSEGRWNQQHFEQIVSNIIKTGKTGDTHLSVEDENALVGAVQLQHAIENEIKENYIRQLGDDYIDYHEGWLAELAFSHAQHAYTSYAQSTASNTTITQNPLFLSPQQLQNVGSLGAYQIDMDDFNEDEIPIMPPRVFHHGQWQTDHQHDFDTTLVSINHMTPGVQEELQNVVRQWRHDYGQMDPEYELHIQSSDVHLRALAQISRSASLVVTHMNVAISASHIPSNLYPSDQTYFAITRYQGRIVNLILISAEEDDDDEHINWEIEFALTEPHSTIPTHTTTPHTYQDGAVRGAGTAALRAILMEAQEMHINSINANVISIPSALMFSRTGFKLIIPSLEPHPW